MSQLNEEEFYQSAINVCNQLRVSGLMVKIQDRFLTFITDIVMEVGRILKQSSPIDKTNNYEPLHIAKLCREKLKDFDLTPRLFDEETRRFYKAIIAGFKRQFDPFSRDYADNYRVKRLKTNQDRFRYHFVEMVLYHKGVILDGTWQYYGVNYIEPAIWKGDVGCLIRHYLRNSTIERHKLGNLHQVLQDAESVLYAVRDTHLLPTHRPYHIR